ILQTEQTPVLLVPASIQRKDGIEGLADTVNKAVAQIQATAKKLGVNVTGPTPPALDSSAPADAGTAAAPAAPAALNPGDHDKFGRLIVDGDVRATLAFGGAALEGVWNGTAAGVPQTRD